MAAALALIIHELATNSLAYGTLSEATGSVGVSRTFRTAGWCWSGRNTEVCRSRAEDVAGFGSKLIRRSIAGQRRGAIDYAWHVVGVVATQVTDKARLATRGSVHVSGGHRRNQQIGQPQQATATRLKGWFKDREGFDVARRESAFINASAGATIADLGRTAPKRDR